MRVQGRRFALAVVSCLLAVASVFAIPHVARAATVGIPNYSSLKELEGKTFAYVNGSVYNLKVQAVVDNTKEAFYPSLADCVAAVEAGKADAAVQLSYCCQLVVNRKGGSVALVPEKVADVDECFFFRHGDPLVKQFNEVIDKFYEDGTIDALKEKWVGADDSKKTLPKQDWDAPNGTLAFATSGVLEPYSYVGGNGEALGYDVELALMIAKELGYKLKVSTIAMDSIFAAVESGKVDFGGSLTDTPEREKVVDFTERVMPDYVAAIVAADESAASVEPQFKSVAELEGKTIAALNGSVVDKTLTNATGLKFKFEYYNQVSDLIQAIKGGKTDAMVEDLPVCKLAIAQNPDLTIMDEAITNDDYGMIFKKGDARCAEFSKVIDRFRTDGTLAALEEKWCGADESAKVMPKQDWDAPNGTLKCATSGTQMPMTYHKKKDVVGYDVELAMLIAKELGYKVEFVVGDFSSVLANVSSGKADFASSCITITDERKKSFDFTSPTYIGSIALVVRNVATEGPDNTVISSLVASFKRTFIEEDRWQLVLSGLGTTVLISVVAGGLGNLLGFVTVLARRSNKTWPAKFVNGYQALMGGVPIVVILMVLYYVVFGALDIPGTIVAIVAFTLSFGSTSGSTMWTAVSSLDNIQEETGMALGFTRAETFRNILFPQAATVFMPQLAGQFVSMVKETSVVGYIAVLDLTRASDLIRSRTMDAFFPLISTAIIYFIFCRILAKVLNALVKRMDMSQRPKTVEGVEL